MSFQWPDGLTTKSTLSALTASKGKLPAAGLGAQGYRHFHKLTWIFVGSTGFAKRAVLAPPSTWLLPGIPAQRCRDTGDVVLPPKAHTPAPLPSLRLNFGCNDFFFFFLGMSSYQRQVLVYRDFILPQHLSFFCIYRASIPH